MVMLTDCEIHKEWGGFQTSGRRKYGGVQRQGRKLADGKGGTGKHMLTLQNIQTWWDIKKDSYIKFFFVRNVFTDHFYSESELFTQMSLTHTSSAIVLSYPELVEVSCISNGEFVIIGIDWLLAILHVNSQLITALSSNLLDVVQTCAEATHILLHCTTADFREMTQFLTVNTCGFKGTFMVQVSSFHSSGCNQELHIQ